MFATLRTMAACAAVASMTVGSAALAGPSGSGDGGSYRLYQTPEQILFTGRVPPNRNAGSMLQIEADASSAAAITQRVSVRINPCCSANGMKLPGATTPRSG